MKFERGKTNLRDIHNFMTSLDKLKSDLQEDVRQKSKLIVKNHIVKTFNIRSSRINTEKRISHIEAGLIELKFEIEAYRNRTRISKNYMLEFNEIFN